MLIFTIMPYKNDMSIMSQCLQFNFGGERGSERLTGSALPVVFFDQLSGAALNRKLFDILICLFKPFSFLMLLSDFMSEIKS